MDLQEIQTTLNELKLPIELRFTVDPCETTILNQENIPELASGFAITGSLVYRDLKAQVSVFLPEDNSFRQFNILTQHLLGFLETELTWLKGLPESELIYLKDAADLTPKRRKEVQVRYPYPEVKYSMEQEDETLAPEDREILNEIIDMEHNLNNQGDNNNDTDTKSIH